MDPREMILILRRLLIITVLIVLPLESYAFRHLDEQYDVSPSPSPSEDSCNMASRSCQLKNIAACLTYSSQIEVYLLVQNNCENPLDVKVMILPTNNTVKEIKLSSHQIKKIKISSDIDLRSSIAINSGDGDCIIHAAASSPENQYLKYPSYGTYINPTNGAYLVIIMLIVGATLTLTCYKLRFRGRHLDGVPYHELEMKNSTKLSKLNMEEEEEEEEEENWDQDWGEEWGDEKNIKSDVENHAIVKPVNGLTVKLQDSNGMRKEWND